MNGEFVLLGATFALRLRRFIAPWGLICIGTISLGLQRPTASAKDKLSDDIPPFARFDAGNGASEVFQTHALGLHIFEYFLVMHVVCYASDNLGPSGSGPGAT